MRALRPPVYLETAIITRQSDRRVPKIFVAEEVVERRMSLGHFPR